MKNFHRWSMTDNEIVFSSYINFGVLNVRDAKHLAGIMMGPSYSSIIMKQKTFRRSLKEGTGLTNIDSKAELVLKKYLDKK